MHEEINRIMKVNENYKRILKQAQSGLTKAPEWRVRATETKGRYYYYYRDSSDKDAPQGGRYVHKEDMDKIGKIVQNEYNYAMISEIEKQQRAIERFVKDYEPDKIKNMYSNLSAARQALTEPLCISDKEYADKWEHYEFERKRFAENAAEYYSERGERVRSKSEKIIADKLYAMGIPYRYECPLSLGHTVIHPDFTVLHRSSRRVYYWEHFGMLDNPEYTEEALRRMDLYGKNGIFPGTELIITYESVGRPMDTKLLNHTIEHYFGNT